MRPVRSRQKHRGWLLRPSALPGSLLQSARPLIAGVLSILVQQPRGETAAPVGLREEAHYRPDRLIVHRFQNARIRESTVGLAWREERTTRPAGRPRKPAGRAAGLNSTSRFMAFLLPGPSLLSKIGSRQPEPHAPAAATCSALAAQDFKIFPAGGRQRIALDSARHAHAGTSFSSAAADMLPRARISRPATRRRGRAAIGWRCRFARTVCPRPSTPSRYRC